MGVNIKTVVEQSKNHIEGFLREWLPGGNVSNNRYYVLNPKRPDSSVGSFSIDLATGAFNDFAAAGNSGGDIVALYAWLNNCRQIEAATAIHERLNGGAALPEHKPRPAKKKEHLEPTWPAPFDAPEAIINGSRSGKPSAVYEYRDANDRLLGYVCRFDRPNGKDVKPLFYFDEKQWLWRGPSGDYPRPIYGIELLKKYPDSPVLIVEGEKAAEVGRVLLREYVVVSWLGGTGVVKKAPWHLLKDRQVTIWPDADDVGHKAAEAIKAVLPDAKIIKLPPDLPKGFDIADCVDEQQARDILNHEQTEKIKIVEQPKDNDGFKYLGIQQMNHRVYYVIYDYSSRLIHKYTANGISWDVLQEIGPPGYWETKYMGLESKKAKSDAARAEIIGRCKRLGLFDESRIRGRGVWMDGGRTVAHIGRSLVVDGKQCQLYELDTDNIYQQKTRIKLSGVPITADEGTDFLVLCQLLSWEVPVAAYLLAGWVFLAPVCGALRWRPHLWITGEAGSGKSWVFDEIIGRVLDNFSVKVQGETTEAGLRQQLANDALPVIFDEAESETQRSESRIQNILALMRQASSSNGAAIIKGSSTGEAMHYSIRSMFAFVSILSGVVQTSDATRVSVLNLQRHHDDPVVCEQHFGGVNAALQALFTDDFINGLKMRAINKLPLILETAETMSRYAAMELKSKRLGDQIGTLLAGMWVLTHDTPPTGEDIADIMEVGDWQSFMANTGSSQKDHEKALAFLLQSTVRHEMAEVSISELIERSQTREYGDSKNASNAAATLSRYGLYIKDGFLRIANTNPQLRRLFKDTPWRGKWNDTLSSIQGAVKSSKNHYMGQGQFPTRCLMLPIEKIMVAENE